MFKDEGIQSGKLIIDHWVHGRDFNGRRVPLVLRRFWSSRWRSGIVRNRWTYIWPRRVFSVQSKQKKDRNLKALIKVISVVGNLTHSSRGGQTFWIAGQISRKNIVSGSKKINEAKFMLVLSKKRLILHVYLQSRVLKLRSALIKFSTRATKNLWQATCGPRASLWQRLH